MNVQVLTDPFGRLLWASPALPGSTHDLTAARQDGIIAALTDSHQEPGQRTRSQSLPRLVVKHQQSRQDQQVE